jgi:hypothetical protein
MNISPRCRRSSSRTTSTLPACKTRSPCIRKR